MTPKCLLRRGISNDFRCCEEKNEGDYAQYGQYCIFSRIEYRPDCAKILSTSESVIEEL
jgi:hypothetical protein